MKSTKRAAAHGLLFLVTMSVVAVTGTEALAQGGRGQTSRGESSSSVERRSAKKKQRAVESRANRSSRQAVERKKTSARSKAGERSRGSAVNNGRTRGSNESASRRPSRKEGETGGRGSRVDDRSGPRAGGSATKARDRNGVDGRVRDGRSTRRDGAVNNRRSRADNRDSSRGTSSATKARDRNGGGGRVHDGRSNDRRGNRSIYVGDRKPARHRNGSAKGKAGHTSYAPHDKRRYQHYRHNRRHHAKYSWCNEYHPAGHHHYIDAHIHIGSHVQIGVRWPWLNRHRHWRPRYRYRQVVNVHVGWGSRRRQNRVDVRTYYRHRVLHADNRYAEIEIDVDAIELYQNDRYLGTVDRIPGALRKMRATVYADGRIDFDRNIFIVGDARAGFEVIATRYYDDYLHNAYDARHGYKVGRVNLRDGKVKMTRRSRLFAPHRFDGFVPISLLPDDDRLWDYGRPYIDGRYDNNDDDIGWYRNYRDRGFDHDDDYELSRSIDVSYRTPQGAEIRMERSTYLDRLD